MTGNVCGALQVGSNGGGRAEMKGVGETSNF